MPAQRPRASFEPIPPDFDLNKLVESTPNFSYVDRISVEMIDQQGLQAFEKLVLLHVINGGKPLVIDGFEDRLDPWTFTPKWLVDNMSEKVENARVLSTKENLPLTMGHYLKNMGKLTDQFFDSPTAYREKGRQRVYLKDIDCPTVWEDKLREHIPSTLYYLNESTGDLGGPGAVPDSTIPGRRLGKGIARGGDLMSSLPPDMRAENLMCYIGHEGTYTPAHREMCASLGQNIMVEASGTVSSDDGKAEKPGSSVWFMTETKDRHIVSEYWLSVLGHDIEVETHFAQIVAWKKAPFNVYVVEQRPGDFILIPPLAPHQVWNRGTRTMKVAWNRTTAETLEMALDEALPRSRIACRDEQYKNKAIVYYTLQKYSSLLSMAQQQAARLPQEAAQQLLYSGKVKQLIRDFKRLFNIWKEILLSEMFNPEDTPKGIEYLPFDSNVTCAYCRSNVFNRFLTCPSCKDMLGHHTDETEGDPYDVCMDCYAMGRSCACISNLKWVEQFRWKELASKYESWRNLIISLDGGQITNKTPLQLPAERKARGKKTLAEVCKEQLKRRPWKDVHKKTEAPKDDEEDEEVEIQVDDNGFVKKVSKKHSKAWLKNNTSCHVCCHRHPNWKMASCTTCDRSWCYGSLWRGWDKMPIEIMEDPDWSCPHCLGICFAGNCRREGKMQPYEPKGTLLGHDTKKVADARSVEALVDFSVSNLNWLKDGDESKTESRRVKRARAEAQKAKEVDPAMDDGDDAELEETRVDYEYSPEGDGTPIDPALGASDAFPGAQHVNEDDDEAVARRLQQVNASLPAAAVAGAHANDTSDGYAPVSAAGYVPPAAQMYPQPGEDNSYTYPGYQRPTEGVDDDDVAGIRGFKRRHDDGDDGEFEDIHMQKGPKMKKPRMSAAGFRSTDLADGALISKARNEAQRQFEMEKERKAMEKAKSEGRFIMLQARLRGKKRLVKLKVPGARLAQLLAQQAAKAALGNGDEADAEHEVEEGAHQDQEEQHEDALLLKSDIAPKKSQNPKMHHKQRESGILVSSKTKKALVPVERDENYGYRARERLPNGTRVEVRAKRMPRQSHVDYEEVDIGSDDEIFVKSSVPQSAKPANDHARRSLPGHLQDRHADDVDLPDELPEDFKDGRTRAPAKQKPLTPAAPTAETSTPKRPVGRPAGKRPAMRPVQVQAQRNRFGGTVDDAEVDDMLDQAESGSFMPVNAVNAKPNGTTSQHSKDVAEQNRLAKLQALEMLGEDGPIVGKAGGRGSLPHTATGPHTVSMAEVITDDEESDDGVESVPARRGAAMQAV